jgi:L-Lysine epsilon oxidase N-terminal/L-lysine epsilon oxidase C-terminal domain
MATIYKIHPAIGVARVGTSSQFYIAPEVGGGLPTDPATGQPVTSFRDAAGDLLKQAQRFRVFSYDDTNPNDPGTEVTAGSGGVAAIEWTVYLANKKACWYQFEQLTGSGMNGDAGYLANDKPGHNPHNPLRNATITDPGARQALIIDPGPRTIGGSGNPTSASFDVSGDFSDPAKTQPNPVKTLGSIQLDAKGNLLVLAGNGASGTTNLRPGNPPVFEYAITAYANNEGWFDDVSDGPVTANIFLTTGASVAVDVPAWCLGAPPKYAPQIVNQVTLFDTMYDVAVRTQNYNPELFSGGAFHPGYLVDFPNEVAPILARSSLYQWVAEIPPAGVTAHVGVAQDSAASFPFYILRAPAMPPAVQNDTNGTNLDINLMPKLAGDNPISENTRSKYLTLTQTQYFLIQQWKSGNVLPVGKTRPALPPAAAIDRAALENCVGGAFCPGIEMTWICRNPSIYSQPFRIRHATNPQQGKLSQTNGNDNLYSQGVEPGDIIKYMAQPWQADFNECSNQTVNPDLTTNDASNAVTAVTFWWWPAQRPYFVYPSVDNPQGDQLPWTRGFHDDPDGVPTYSMPNVGDMQMVVNWKDLGFVVLQQGPTGPVYVEVERDTHAVMAYQPPLLKGITAPVALTRPTGRIAPRAMRRASRLPQNR